MNAAWKRLSARIDGLNLRERLFLFLAVMVVCVALVDSLWVSPARQKHQLVRQTFDANAAEMRQLQDELRLQALKPSPARRSREELARIRAQVDDTDRSISALSAATGGGTSLADVLVHFLRRHASLTLVRTSSVAVPPPAGTSAQDVAQRTGQELTIAGPYADLLRYVRTLETAMPDLRWGPLQLKADQQPPELTLQVFLVGSTP